MIDVRQADLTSLPAAAMLFNAYRVFYEQPSDLAGAEAFLKARITNKESILYIAYKEENPVGFTQLYPSFTSVGMKPIWILNDLYVNANARKMGVGEALIEKAKSLGKETGAKRVVLETAVDNVVAQGLYDKTGFKRGEGFYNYSVELA
ncbi:MAG: GNAT family N-acetyltransferase [Bacteroidota bacterium]